MPGRKPKPTALKELAGNAGKRPLNRAEPRPEPKVPDCPAYLVGQARAEWERIAPELLRLGLLTGIDAAALAGYCLAYATVAEAERHLAPAPDGRSRLVVKAPQSGYAMQNPFVGIRNAALDQMRKFLVEFGMTPSSRSRIQVAPAPPADPVEDFLKRRPSAQQTTDRVQ